MASIYELLSNLGQALAEFSANTMGMDPRGDAQAALEAQEAEAKENQAKAAEVGKQAAELARKRQEAIEASQTPEAKEKLKNIAHAATKVAKAKHEFNNWVQAAELEAKEAEAAGKTAEASFLQKLAKAANEFANQVMGIDPKANELEQKIAEGRAKTAARREKLATDRAARKEQVVAEKNARKEIAFDEKAARDAIANAMENAKVTLAQKTCDRENEKLEKEQAELKAKNAHKAEQRAAEAAVMSPSAEHAEEARQNAAAAAACGREAAQKAAEQAIPAVGPSPSEQAIVARLTKQATEAKLDAARKAFVAKAQAPAPKKAPKTKPSPEKKASLVSKIKKLLSMGMENFVANIKDIANVIKKIASALNPFKTRTIKKVVHVPSNLAPAGKIKEASPTPVVPSQASKRLLAPKATASQAQIDPEVLAWTMAAQAEAAETTPKAGK